MKKPIANDYAGKVWMHKVNPSDGIICGELRFRSCKVFSYPLAGEGVSGKGQRASHARKHVAFLEGWPSMPSTSGHKFVGGLQASRKLYFVHTFSLIRLLCGSRHHHADGGKSSQRFRQGAIHQASGSAKSDATCWFPR